MELGGWRWLEVGGRCVEIESYWRVGGGLVDGRWR